MVKRRGRDTWALVALTATALVLVGCGGGVDSQAKKSLESKINTATLSVYPVGVMRGSDIGSAKADVEAIVQGLAGAGFRTVVGAPEAPPVKLVWMASQKAMLREIAGQVSEWVRRHPPDGDFGLYAQYLLRQEGDSGEKVAGIQWLIADKTGRIAAMGVIDADNPVFRQVNPKGRADCTPLLLAGVKHELGGMMAKAGSRPNG